MAARLEAIARDLDPRLHPFLNTPRVRMLNDAVAHATDRRQRYRLKSNLADELLKTGATEQAIALVQTLLAPEALASGDAPPEIESRRFLALCLYRLGVQENCMAHPNPERCLLPVGGAGVHAAPRGTRAAVRELTALLHANPDDLIARWMLTVAAMALGEYPREATAGLVVPPEAFAPEHEVGRFGNVAIQAGLGVFNHAGGALMDDFDGDGLLDVVVSSMGLRDPMRFFRNLGNGTFADASAEAGLAGEVGGLNMTHADYDNDGDLDILVLRGGWARTGGRFPNSLLRNDGHGGFEDVTEEAGILSFHPTQAGAWGDYDGDGRLDLFVGNESVPGDPHPSELWHNEGDGTFRDRSADLGDPDLGYVKGAAWGDYDNDGRPDLYVSVFGGDNRLFHNDGPAGFPGFGRGHWNFSERAGMAGVTEPKDSFPTWFWDYDNDGWLDILVGGFRITEAGGAADVAALYLGRPVTTEVPRLYRNLGNGAFRDVTRAARIDRVILPMGSGFGDIDNDGFPDAYFGTGAPSLMSIIPNRLFRNDGGRVFQEVTASAGVGHLQKGHGVAFGDLDNDGDQDLFEQMGGFYEGDVAQNVLYKNPGHGHHWITLRLEGTRANRCALGARIRVITGGGRVIHALVSPGGSFAGSSLQQEIGLGDEIAIESVEVTWPGSPKIQVYRGLSVDGTYRLVEGRAEAARITVHRFAL